MQKKTLVNPTDWTYPKSTPDSKRKNQTKYFNFILLLSGDIISLNPRPPHNSQIDGLRWNVFDKKKLHYLHISLNSLLPKVEVIRFIVKRYKATVIGFSETKLDETIFDAEIYYSIVRCDRDRKGGGVACYIKHDICSALKIFFLRKSKSSLWICSFRKPSPYL